MHSVNDSSEMTFVLSLQQLGSNTKSQQKAVLMYAHILYLKPAYVPTVVSGEESECSSRINDANFLIVFCSNYGLTHDHGTDNGRETTDGPTTATTTHLALKVGVSV